MNKLFGMHIGMAGTGGNPRPFVPVDQEGFSLLDSAGNPLTVPSTVIDSSGATVTISAEVLDSLGASITL